MVKTLLRLEGLAVFALTVFVYSLIGGSWPLFGALFFLPDLGMVGYLISPRIGAYAYNILHTYALAAALVAVSWFGFSSPLFLGLILAAHIGLDRALGFGLKYPDGFAITHLQRV